MLISLCPVARGLYEHSFRACADLMPGKPLSLKQRLRNAKRGKKQDYVRKDGKRVTYHSTIYADPPRQHDTGLWDFLRQVVSCDVSGCTAKGADWTQCACRDKRAAEWFRNSNPQGVSFYDNKPRDGGNIR